MNEMTELASICTSDLTQTAGLGTGPVSCEPYRSPAYFERERENLFKRAWLTVGRVEQLPEKGSFFTKTIEIWNAPIVVTRGSDDRIQAFYNVCAHSGNPVVLTERGRASRRSEEHTSELQSLMRTSYAVFCLKKKHKSYCH